MRPLGAPREECTYEYGKNLAQSLSMERASVGCVIFAVFAGEPEHIDPREVFPLT